MYMISRGKECNASAETWWMKMNFLKLWCGVLSYNRFLKFRWVHGFSYSTHTYKTFVDLAY